MMHYPWIIDSKIYAIQKSLNVKENKHSKRTEEKSTCQSKLKSKSMCQVLALF